MAASLACFTITEPLGVAWTGQLLCRHVTFEHPVDFDRLRLLRDDGVEVPFQADEIERGRGGVLAATLWFWCDLPANGRQEYRLEQSRRKRNSATLAPAKVGAEGLVLENRFLRIKLTGTQRYRKPVPAAEVPGPVSGFSRPGQPWIGGSHWETRLDCTAIATEITASGRLWTEARVHYTFTQGASYAMTVRLYADRDFAVIDEQIATRIDGRLVMNISDGLEPDRFYVLNTCAAIENDGHSTVAPLPPPGDRLREIQVPAIGAYYVPHLTGYVGLFNARQKRRGLVGVVGMDGELWESAMHNRMRMARRPDGEVVLEMPAKAGRRRWALTITDVAPAIVTGSNEQSTLLKLQIRHSQTPLRDVLAMQLSLPQAPPAVPLLFTDEVVTRARTRLAFLPEFTEHLAAIRRGEVDEPAFGYLMTGERHFAEQTRDAILHGLRYLLERILTGGTTDNSATTIALSRTLRQWALPLDLLRREPELLDNAVGREIERLFLFFAHKMMSQNIWPYWRVGLHQDHPESQKPLYSYPGDVLPDVKYWINCLPNFQSDWTTSLATIALLYASHPRAQDWIEACRNDLDAQFDELVFPTGAWIESMNYAMYTLNYYSLFFIMLKNAGGRDFFADERLQRWLHWHTRMLTPPDPRIDGLQTQAYVGNAILPDGQAATLNWMAKYIPDPELAGRLVEVWRREGSPAFAHRGYRIIEALLDPDQPSRPLPPFGSSLEPGFGAILRDGEGTEEETFLTFKVGRVFSHYEGDELAFHWHARGVPLCSEYGVYQGPSCAWAAHNVVEVPARDSIRRGLLTDSYFDAGADYLVGEHPGLIRYFEDFPEGFADPNAPRFSQKYNYLDHETPLGPKVWLRRALLFVKPHYLVLLDDVDGVTPSRYNVHCVADDVQVTQHGIEFSGRFGMDLSVFIAEPEAFTVETGRHAPERPPVDHSQLFARIRPNGANHYRTVLYPHTRAEAVSCRRLADGIGMEVTGPCGLDRVWLARDTVECAGEGVTFIGKAAFIRQAETLALHLLRGRQLAFDGLCIDGEGPVHLERHPDGRIEIRTDGPARRVAISAGAPLKAITSSSGATVIHEGATLVVDLAPGKQQLQVAGVQVAV